MKAVIFARDNNSGSDKIIKQIEICENFARFYEYEIVGIATDVETLFKTSVEYDAVIVTRYNRISRDPFMYQQIKNDLLKRDIIIIAATRP